MVDVKLLEKTPEVRRFLLKGASPALANTLRRLVINEVPTLAIEKVTVQKNSSAMFDEFIAHRLGLIPLKTDLKTYTLMRDCSCKGKGCARCQLHFTLEVKGPATVYAEDLVSKDPKVKPVHPKTPIVKLLKKQVLELEAVAVLGEGKDHVKFSPALAYYQAVPSVTVGKVENPEAVAHICPTKVFEVKGGKLAVADEMRCILCMACVDLTEGKVAVEGSRSDFIFTLESWGQLEPGEIMAQAMEVQQQKMGEFRKLLKKL